MRYAAVFLLAAACGVFWLRAAPVLPAEADAVHQAPPAALARAGSIAGIIAAQRGRARSLDDEDYVVPGVAHQIWLGGEAMLSNFSLLSALSIYFVQRPHTFLLHIDEIPKTRTDEQRAAWDCMQGLAQVVQHNATPIPPGWTTSKYQNARLAPTTDYWSLFPWWSVHACAQTA